MSGYLKSITIEGYTFGVPNDCEVKVHVGGEQITEYVTFGNNETRAVKKVVPGRLEGCQVDANELSVLESFLGKERLSIRVETDDKSYTCEGMIVVESLGISTKNNVTDAFDIVSNTGKLKHS